MPASNTHFHTSENLALPSMYIKTQGTHKTHSRTRAHTLLTGPSMWTQSTIFLRSHTKRRVATYPRFGAMPVSMRGTFCGCLLFFLFPSGSTRALKQESQMEEFLSLKNLTLLWFHISVLGQSGYNFHVIHLISGWTCFCPLIKLKLKEHWAVYLHLVI